MENGGKILTVVEGREINWRMVEGLKRAAHARGWKFQQILKISCDDITTGAFEKYFSPFVVWRALSGALPVRTEWLKMWCRKQGYILLNGNVVGGTQHCSDKCFMYGIYRLDEEASQWALPLHCIRTGVGYVDKLVERGDLAYPFVLKPRFGTAGKEIFLVSSREEFAELYKKHNLYWYGAQRLVEVEVEWRVFVVGGVAVCIMRKNSSGDIDKTNFKKMSAGYDKGYEGDQRTIEEISRIAAKIAAISGLEYTGVDIIREKQTGRYYVLETNLAAGWQNGVLEATGVDVPTKIMDWFVDMDFVKQNPRAVGIERYIKNRLHYLSKKKQELYDQIVEMKTVLPVDEGKNDLFSRVLKAYNEMIRSQDTKNDTLVELIREVEQCELSQMGGFLPVGTGTLDEALVPSAAFVAIVRAMVRVRSSSSLEKN